MRRMLTVLATLCLFVASCSNTTPSVRKEAPLLERGMNLYVCNDPSVDTPDKLNARLNEIFAYLHDLNVNAVALYFPLLTDHIWDDTVSAGPKTPSLAMLRQIITFAHGRNMKVKLRPSIDTANLGGFTRDELQPIDRKAWFTSYTKTLLPFAKLARETGVEEFQVGNELNKLEGDPGWATLLDTLRSEYRRSFTYTIGWGTAANGTAKPPTAVYGILAYPPFALPDTATVAELTTAWNGWLDRVGRHYKLRGMALDEVGIPGVSTAYHAPWALDGKYGTGADLQVQANWFAAACAAVKQRNLRGIYFSEIDLSRSPSQKLAPGELPGQFVGRPAEEVIRNCFAV